MGANNAKCLRANNANGAPVQVTPCTGGADQEWKFGPNGAVSLYNGTMCLDVCVPPLFPRRGGGGGG